MIVTVCEPGDKVKGENWRTPVVELKLGVTLPPSIIIVMLLGFMPASVPVLLK